MPVLQAAKGRGMLIALRAFLGPDKCERSTHPEGAYHPQIDTEVVFTLPTGQRSDASNTL